MKKSFKARICALVLFSVLLVSASPIINAASSTDNNYNGVDLSRNSSLYGKKIWEGNAVYSESFMLYKGRDKVKMLYPIDEVISVRSYNMQTVYTKGTDFDVVDGQLVPIASGSMKIYGNAADENVDDMKNLTASGSIDYNNISSWNTKSYKYQYYITYTHSAEWDNTKVYNKAPTSQTDKLSKFYEKVKNGEQVNIVFYGDSITEGWNASGLNRQSYLFDSSKNASELGPRTCKMYDKLGLTSVPDWACDIYADQVVAALKKFYNNNNITVSNKAIGSTASSWGSKQENLEFLVGGSNPKPDLFVLAYGMNEYNNSASAQNANTKKIIDYVRTLNPDCSVLLVSAFYPNMWDGAKWTSYSLGAQEKGYYELAKQYGNLAVAPVYSVFESVLTAKESCDYTSNLYNHPNDFGVRLYAEVLTSVLTPGNGTPEDDNKGSGGDNGSSEITSGDSDSLSSNKLDIKNSDLYWEDEWGSVDNTSSSLNGIPQSGDKTNPLLWLGILLISGGAAAATVIYKRRKRKSESEGN